MSGHVEHERKYALTAGQQLPDLSGVAALGPVAEFDLVATYYDSPDLRLTRAKRVIRLREGGRDDGWHLKVPGDGPDERVELHSPVYDGAPTEVPGTFWSEVADDLDGAPLVPVAVLRTHRREQSLLGPDGSVRAFTCTDDVRAEVGSRVEHWREAEVELAGGDVALLDAIETRLAGQGIHRAVIGSKVARALGAPPDLRPLGPGSSAGEVVLGYLASQVGVLQRFSSRLGSDRDAIHDARVATRRLRATLLVYGDVLEHSSVRKVSRRLRGLTRLLGELRDFEVAVQLLIMDPAVDLFGDDGNDKLFRTVDGLEHFMSEQHESVRDYIGSQPDQEFQRSLVELLARPPLTALAAEPAVDVLPGLRAIRVRQLTSAGEWISTHFSLLTTWHDLRKQAKIVRYATEVLVPVLPELAARKVSWERVTEALGALQDVVMTHSKFDELVLAEVAEGEDPATFDGLRRLLQDRLAPLLASAKTALRAALANEP